MYFTILLANNYTVRKEKSSDISTAYVWPVTLITNDARQVYDLRKIDGELEMRNWRVGKVIKKQKQDKKSSLRHRYGRNKTSKRENRKFSWATLGNWELWSRELTSAIQNDLCIELRNTTLLK